MGTGTFAAIVAGLFVGFFANDIAMYAGKAESRLVRVAVVLAVYILGIVVGGLP